MNIRQTNNLEIEARFLVCGDSWRGKGESVDILQGYLSVDRNRVLRLRIEDDRATMTVKGKTVGLARKEYEFFLDDLDKARDVIHTFCPYPIQKVRHRIWHLDFLWEIDEFKGQNRGLVIAEVEFSEENDYRRMISAAKPPWIGKEISAGEWQYTNAGLSERPFSIWTTDEQDDMRRHAASRADGCL